MARVAMEVGFEGGTAQAVPAQISRTPHKAIGVMVRKQENSGVFVRHGGRRHFNNHRQVDLAKGIPAELDLIIVEATRKSIPLVVTTSREHPRLGGYGFEERVPDFNPIREAHEIGGGDAVLFHELLYRGRPFEPDVAVGGESPRNQREFVNLIDENARINDQRTLGELFRLGEGDEGFPIAFKQEAGFLSRIRSEFFRRAGKTRRNQRKQERTGEESPGSPEFTSERFLRPISLFLHGFIHKQGIYYLNFPASGRSRLQSQR